MSLSLKKIKDKLLHSDSICFTFLRSLVSSQAASWADMSIGFVLFSVVGLSTFVSTAVGAISGGILNCLINYRFTFHASHCSWRAVSVKYAMVWVGSVLLNSFGTELLYRLFKLWPWLEQIGFTDDGFYAAARLLASLIISLGWNFILQRNLVYRESRFDKYAIRFTNTLWPDSDNGLGAFRIWKPIGILSSLAAVALGIYIIIEKPTHHIVKQHKQTISELQQQIQIKERQIAELQSAVDSLKMTISTMDTLTPSELPVVSTPHSKRTITINSHGY